jgi:hypothetical protein
MFVLPATGGANPILYWTEGSSLMKASLIPAGPSIPVVTPGPSAPSAAPSTSGSAAAGPPSPKPSATKS